jgi:DNA-binding protein HU-beta
MLGAGSYSAFRKAGPRGPFAFDSLGKKVSDCPLSKICDSYRHHEILKQGGSQMNKNDLISAVADASGLSKNDASNAVESVFDAITKALSGGDEVRLVGFGTFSVAKRKASTGRNPRTGEPMKIKASNQPKFKAGKGLKDAVN